MLDYRTILTLRYSVGLSGTDISRQIDNASKTGVNDFLRAFEQSCKQDAAFEKWHRVRRERVRKRNRKRVILPEGSFSEFFPFRFVFNDFQ